jgi:glycosyltransferase involved in cell wall biosynthesis
MAGQERPPLLESAEEGFTRGGGAHAAYLTRGYTARVTPLSAVLIAQNEEGKIGEAVESVRFCDEVVVVDSGSEDRTRAIAQTAGARVILNAPWPGFVAQREFAVRAARHDWVLALDADERVTPGLREEVEGLRARGFGHAAYRIPRVAFHLGCWVRGTDWYPDEQVRVFDRTRARWEGDLVHESVRAAGPVGRLRGELLHYPYADVSDHLRKIDRYTTLWARQFHSAGRRTGPVEIAAAGLWAFFRNYVVKGGFRLGTPGLVISTLNAYYTFVKLAKLYELTRYRSPS